MASIPLKSDRSAFDVINYPTYHANDLDTNAPVHHVPAGTVTGQTLRWDGAKWVTAPNSILAFGTIEGDIAVSATPFKMYNKFGQDRVITEVFLSVGTAPTGASLIVDVKVDGVSIFTGGNEPAIADGATTGNSTTIASPTWALNSYLTWNVTQIGSTLSGADLVVHIIHRGA